MSPIVLFGLSILAGLGFSLIGVMYRVAQLRSVTPQRLLMICAFCGAVFFGVRLALNPDIADAPALLLILGVAAGLSQSVAIKLVGAAMKDGPFAPIWCALSLYFIPVIVYAGVVFVEPVSLLQYLSIALAISAVVCGAGASGEQDGASSADAAPSRAPRPLLYGALLLAVLLVNGLPPMALKDLSMRPAAGDGSYLERFRDLYFLLFYVSLAVGLIAESHLAGDLARGWRRAWPLGILAGAGSIVGVFALSKCTSQSAALVFVVSGAVTLLVASVVAVAFLRERLTGRWAGTVALALLAILCNAQAPSRTVDSEVSSQQSGVRIQKAVMLNPES